MEDKPLPQPLGMREILSSPPPPSAKWDGETLLCDRCGAPADTIHLVPHCVETKRIEACCPDHDAGGYWLPASELGGGWLYQLAGKQGDALQQLLFWLGRPACVRLFGGSSQ